MITKYVDFSGVFSVKINNNTLYFNLRYNENEFPIKIFLYLNDKKYQELSIILPKSEELDKQEFFLNPDVNKKIIDVLINENFIEISNNKSVAGDQKTISYKLI